MNFKLGLLLIGLLAALAGIFEVQARQHGSRDEAAVRGQQRAGPLHRLASTLESQAGIELPAEYRAVRPADVDDALPGIPPSELWPAQ